VLFLIEYDRRRGRIISFRAFNDLEGREAEDSRLQLELELNQRGTEREVVLLEAASEEALRRTHRRYFEELSELVNSPAR
jgi:hypothetical protein